ncbi:MAG: hypothetical protein WBP16_01720 [Ferruginibacter sp.]
MKSVLFIFLFASGVCFGQTDITGSGKAEFKKQSLSEKPDYSIPYRILRTLIKQYPDSVELYYFLGYSIDRMNSGDGSTMFKQNRDMTIEASEAFETVNRLSPFYNGEYVVLDPYAKLSSIWGSLAQAYLVRGQKDSARWAFTEGKRRGGFTEPILHYNRQLLNSCAKNAILITVGDNISIPAWYLQEVENYRNDVTIVDASLINTSWYCKYLKNEQKLDISFTDTEIDRIDYVEFETRFLTITNPKDSTEKFTWQLKPTYLDKYVLKGDRILLNILKQSLFTRDFYFSFNSDSTWNLFLEDHLFNEGLADKLSTRSIELNTATDSVSANFKNYSIEKLAADEIKKSKDAIILLNNYRWAYYVNIGRLLREQENEKARILKNEMEIKFPLSKLPYPFEGAELYFKKLFDKID